MKGLRDKYEAHHKVKISDEAIDDAVKMSSRYIADRFLPDKAIDLIDEAASRVRLKAYTAPDNIKAMEKKLSPLKKRKARQCAHRILSRLQSFVISKIILKSFLMRKQKSGKIFLRIK